MKTYTKPEVKKENSKTLLVEQVIECRCSGCTVHSPVN